jgi:hypothetical protein
VVSALVHRMSHQKEALVSYQTLSIAFEAKVQPRRRDRHGYGKTRGFSKMGSAGTGTVVNFGTLRHTVYPYRGIAGMYG